MIWYDFHLLELGFHQVAVVGRFVQKQETAIYMGRNNTQHIKQNITKTQNKKHRRQTHKTRNNHKKNIKNISQVMIK
jgi:hypothetical protein